MARFIFITGGVVSSLGKGLAASSLAAILIARGYKVRLKKLDPYLNVDPGTMSPMQHGEVFVTEDGAETDLDLGHYERFTNVDALSSDNVTTGKIYSRLIAKERKGDYLGGTVQVIPHITDLIKEFIVKDTNSIDFVLCEIGGTVGDIEGLPFYEAIRQLAYNLGKKKAIFVHLTLLPYIACAKELKTKPTQHSVKELRSIGIQPDILICRADREIPIKDIKKIALFCNLKHEDVIPSLDISNIYQAPIEYHNRGFDERVLEAFEIKNAKQPDLSIWQDIVVRVENPIKEIKIGIVGKYTKLRDAYKSVSEALNHAGIALNTKVKIKWINSRILNNENIEIKLKNLDGILIPGGFGKDGLEGKILAINYSRINNIPIFGICLGMQLSLIEIARNLCGLEDANTTELDSECKNPVIALMKEWTKGDLKEKRSNQEDIGGTMRLGAYPCEISSESLARRLYKTKKISERHRHRYEVNLNYRSNFEEVGVVFSGLSPDGNLTEIIELKNHKFFIGVQFHPELKSRPFEPHPLFLGFVEASINSKYNE